MNDADVSTFEVIKDVGFYGIKVAADEVRQGQFVAGRHQQILVKVIGWKGSNKSCIVALDFLYRADTRNE